MLDFQKTEAVIKRLEEYIKSSYGWQCHRIGGLRVLCEAAIAILQKLDAIESRLDHIKAEVDDA